MRDENRESRLARIRRWLTAALLRAAQPPLPEQHREAMWSIPASFLYVYFGLMVLLCAPPLAVIIAERIAVLSGGSWWMQPITIIRESATEFGPVGIGNAIASLVIAQGGFILMVLYYHMLSKLVYPVIKRHEERGKAQGVAEGEARGRAEGEARGRAEGEARGRAESNKKWRKWNQERIDHEAQGLPFDKPPPDDEDEPSPADQEEGEEEQP